MNIIRQEFHIYRLDDWGAERGWRWGRMSLSFKTGAEAHMHVRKLAESAQSAGERVPDYKVVRVRRDLINGDMSISKIPSD